MKFNNKKLSNTLSEMFPFFIKPKNSNLSGSVNGSFESSLYRITNSFYHFPLPIHYESCKLKVYKLKQDELK